MSDHETSGSDSDSDSHSNFEQQQHALPAPVFFPNDEGRGLSAILRLVRALDSPEQSSSDVRATWFELCDDATAAVLEGSPGLRVEVLALAAVALGTPLPKGAKARGDRAKRTAIFTALFEGNDEEAAFAVLKDVRARVEGVAVMCGDGELPAAWGLLVPCSDAIATDALLPMSEEAYQEEGNGTSFPPEGEFEDNGAAVGAALHSEARRGKKSRSGRAHFLSLKLQLPVARAKEAAAARDAKHEHDCTESKQKAKQKAKSATDDRARMEKALNKFMINPLLKRANHHSLDRLDMLMPFGKAMKAGWTGARVDELTLGVAALLRKEARGPMGCLLKSVATITDAEADALEKAANSDKTDWSKEEDNDDLYNSSALRLAALAMVEGAVAVSLEAEKLTGVKRALANALGPEFTKKIKEEFGQLNEKELALSVIENVESLTQAKFEIADMKIEQQRANAEMEGLKAKLKEAAEELKLVNWMESGSQDPVSPDFGVGVGSGHPAQSSSVAPSHPRESPVSTPLALAAVLGNEPCSAVGDGFTFQGDGIFN